MSSDDSPCVVLVLDNEQVASSLARLLVEGGYQVFNKSTEAINNGVSVPAKIDVCISDTQSEEVFDSMYAAGCFFIPVDNIPSPLDQQNFRSWARELVNQVNAAVRSSPTLPATQVSGRATDIKCIWTLIGSAGATPAVQEFLNAFETAPNVGFIFAQHYSLGEENQLARFTAENPAFTMKMSVGWSQVAAGMVVVIDPQCQVSLDQFGNIAASELPWSGQHTPNLQQLLNTVANARLPSSGVIVFSGMGRDGIDALSRLHGTGSQIWAQSPQSAVCDSMPCAAIDTGLVEFIGTPTELARALARTYQ